MIVPILLGLGTLAFAKMAGSQSGGTVPAGSGGAAGGAAGGPPAPGQPPSPPSAPPGKWPAPGEAWRPRQDLPWVIAAPLPGRHEIQNLAESPGDAPPERDKQVLAWLDAGRLDAPTWWRIPVKGGLEVEVMGDVVSYGGVRLCASMIAAQGIADAWDALIMTAGIANAVWTAARVRLAPKTIDPNPGGGKAFMLYTADRYQEALLTRLGELASQGQPLIPFIVDTLGKDYVLDARLLEQPDRCAIYGLHVGKDGRDQTVIQSGNTGASLIHHLGFFDYSQAIRLVRRRCWLNGQQADLAEVYRSRPELVTLLAGQAAPPARHPAIPFRRPPGTVVAGATWIGDGAAPGEWSTQDGRRILSQLENQVVEAESVPLEGSALRVYPLRFGTPNDDPTVPPFQASKFVGRHLFEGAGGEARAVYTDPGVTKLLLLGAENPGPGWMLLASRSRLGAWGEP